MTKRIFFVVGEASGDEHAAKLINELSTYQQNDIEITGIGGQCMAKAGANVLYSLAQYGVTGFTEVFRQFKHIKTAFKLAKDYISKHPIDLVILVDYPGFNLRFAKVAHALGIKVLYYISPQIWAWKAKRIHTIKQYVDVMAVILPFEKKLYLSEQIPAYFVGNPISGINAKEKLLNNIRAKYNLLPHKRKVGILPGSRKNELKRILPTFLKAALLAQNTEGSPIQFIIPIASSLKPSDFQSYLCQYPMLDLVIIENENSTDVMACCDLLMLTSGTASLQAAILQKPSLIAYKTSFLSYLIATQVIKCRYIGLPNIITNEMIIPEFIQDDFTPENISKEVQILINNQTYYTKRVQQLKKVSEMLENKSVDCRLAELVFDLITIGQIPIKDASKRNQFSQIEANKTSDPEATHVESPSVILSSELKK